MVLSYMVYCLFCYYNLNVKRGMLSTQVHNHNHDSQYPNLCVKYTSNVQQENLNCACADVNLLGTKPHITQKNIKSYK